MSGEPEQIVVRGACEHNLKSVNVRIPRNKLVVLTGLSGSGKSSLAFDTLYAEGQRRYVESLSAYARQFLDQMKKPEVDSIEGLSPAISIEQKTTSRNPRSTVGTVTEIYDYLRLLYARIGVPHCVSCGKPIQAQTVKQMCDRVQALPEGTRLQVLSPVVRGRKGEYKKELREFARQGFVRVRIDGEDYQLDTPPDLDRKKRHDIDLVIDRLVIRSDVGKRLADSLETALRASAGFAKVDIGPGQEEVLFSELAACMDCGASYPLPAVEEQLKSRDAPFCSCGAILKPDVVFFGEVLPAGAINRAYALAAEAALLLVVGSALEVWPVAELPLVTRRAGGAVAIVNLGPTARDGDAELKIDGSAGETLESVVTALAAD